MKVCSKCNKELEECEYYTNNRNKDNLNSWCKKCDNIKSKLYRLKNKEKLDLYNKKYYYDNHEAILDQKKEYHAKNKQALNEKSRKYYNDNIDILRIQQNKYFKEIYYPKNSSKYCIKARNRESSVLTQMPPWADKNKIQEFYDLARQLTKDTGINHDVDHIYPLNGVNFSGLHVHYNLQVITSKENRSKGNRI